MKEYDIIVVIWEDRKSDFPNLTSGILLKETAKHYVVISDINPFLESVVSRTIKKSSAVIKRYGKIKLSENLTRIKRPRKVKRAVMFNE